MERQDQIQAATAVLSVALASCALWVSRESDTRSREAEARTVAADERVYANDVLFISEPLTDPTVSKVINEANVGVANYGRLPISDVMIYESSPSEDLPGFTSVMRLGRIAPCEGVFVRTDGSFLSGYSVFSDANGKRWSRDAEQPPEPWEPDPEILPAMGRVESERQALEDCR